MAASPLTSASSEPATVVVKSNGNPIPDTCEVLSVVVRAELDRIPEAVIRLVDGDPAEGAFPLADAETFKPGAAIEIAAGYGGAADVATLFSGVVVAVRLRIGAENAGCLEVSCRDKAFCLTLGRSSRVLADVTDSDAITTIVGEAGLESAVGATSETHATLVQYRATDWDFLLARAALNGMVVCVRDGKITVRPPYDGSAPVLTVTYGQDLVSFDGEIDARSQFATVTASGWDIGAQAAATGSAAPEAGTVGNLAAADLAAVGNRPFAIEGATALGSSRLEGIAKAAQTRARLAHMRGRALFQGSARAVPGAMLELAQLGARFSGEGLIGSVTHRIEDGLWLTEAGLGLDPERIAAPPRGGGATALQVGKVVKLVEDPNAQSMIRVQLPLVGQAPSELWARLGGPYCSNGAGLMFLPEIGDEVIVGFFDEDPSFAVVLGSLHSASNAPPVAPNEKNSLKTVLTPQKLKLQFDDEKKRLTLATPAGNTVVLDDDAKSVRLADQNGNSVELASGGITLNSAADVTIKATGKVSIDAGADATLAGINVTATAQAGFSASGTASAELKASGTLKVQGALVQIN